MVLRLRFVLPLISTLACAQDIETDRPDVAPYTVPKGSVQFENGLTWTYDERSRVLDFTESLVRFGVGENAEVRVEIPSYFENFSRHTPGSGIGDLLIGAKQRIGSVAGFDLAIVPGLSLPTGSTTRSSHSVDPQLEFPWQHELIESWSLSGTEGVFSITSGGRRGTQIENQIELEKEITPRADIFVEYQSFLGDGAANNSIQLGGGYKLRPNHRFDFFVVAGLSRAAPSWAVGVGYSFRLDGLWSR